MVYWGIYQYMFEGSSIGGNLKFSNNHTNALNNGKCNARILRWSTRKAFYFKTKDIVPIILKKYQNTWVYSETWFPAISSYTHTESDTGVVSSEQFILCYFVTFSFLGAQRKWFSIFSNCRLYQGNEADCNP